MSIHVVVNFAAAPGHAAELLAVLTEGRDLSRRAAGCLSFDVFQRDDDDHAFMYLEHWASMNAQEANMADMFERGHVQKIIPLLAGQPDKSVIQLIA